MRSLESALKREEGYTLVETLVALVLFTSVAIPIGGVVGLWALDRSTEKLNAAVLAAQAEMNRAILHPRDATILRENHLLIRRVPTPRREGLLEVRISVVPEADTTRTMVTLYRLLQDVP